MYSVHSPYSTVVELVDIEKETIISEIFDDDSCSVLPKTDYDNKIVAFSKSYDFTKEIYNKLPLDTVCNIIHINTGDEYGIDVNRIVTNNRFEEEQEVLFPLKCNSY